MYISADILSVTNRPLALKKTIVNEQIIEALRAFLVKVVDVEPLLQDGKPFQPQYVLDDAKIQKKSGKEETGILSTNTFFYQLYMEAVKGFKQLYIGWQSGATIDIGKVRNVILPLIEESFDQRDEIFKIYHYCKVEEYYFHHPVTVSLLSSYLARKLNFNQGDINQIAIAGLLSDCGMAKVNPSILTKKIALTESDYKEVKQHPVHSYNMLKNVMSIKEGVKMGVLQHHERIDGSGYPLAVRGEQLYPFGKIIALADTYQAMVSIRPYRSKQSPFKVLEQIMKDEFVKFDLTVLGELKKGIANFSSGTKVRLSNGETAEIVFIDDQYPTRPMVKLDQTAEIVALKDKNAIYIEELI